MKSGIGLPSMFATELNETGVLDLGDQRDIFCGYCMLFSLRHRLC